MKIQTDLEPQSFGNPNQFEFLFYLYISINRKKVISDRQIE